MPNTANFKSLSSLLKISSISLSLFVLFTRTGS